METRKLCWFSAGVTSAVACKMAVMDGGNVEIAYCDTGGEHPDNARFIKDCEKWFGQPIKILKSKKYSDIWDVFEKTRYLAGVQGARCTTEMKKLVRREFENLETDTQVFGFDYSEKERAKKFVENNPEVRTEFPLISAGLSKQDCLEIIGKAGIEAPMMYKLGYKNNNCFSGVTAFITKTGVKRFADCVGHKMDVLTSIGWSEGLVESHGPQQIVEITVERSGFKYVVETTSDHEWLVPRYVSKTQGMVIKRTMDLLPGEVIPYGYIRGSESGVKPDVKGVQHGIVFGDGSLYTKYSKAYLCGGKKELAYFFDPAPGRVQKNGTLVFHGLPKEYKTVPCVTTKQEYKLGFLVGLLATDGCVSNGHITISNASEEKLSAIRSLCKSIGWSVSHITTRTRDTNYKKGATLSQFSVSSDSIDKSWLLTVKQRHGFSKKTTSPKGFKVVSVEKTSRFENVFCLFVPGVHDFTLGIGALTRNCIGCVKGQSGYWNKIRKDFPEIFSRMALMERKLNVALNKSYAGDGKRKRIFLDELPPDMGRYESELEIKCGLICGE